MHIYSFMVVADTTFKDLASSIVLQTYGNRLLYFYQSAYSPVIRHFNITSQILFILPNGYSIGQPSNEKDSE